MSTNAVLETWRAVVSASSPRPVAWQDIVGNTRAVQIVREAVKAGQIMGRAPAHLLLYGPPGTGKSSMAALVAGEIGGEIVATTASTLETPIDVIQILERLNEGFDRTGKPSTLYLDEAHMLGVSRGRQAIDVESMLPLLEDWHFPHGQQGKDFVGGDGEKYVLRNNDYRVWPFTCVAATTDPGLLAQPLLRRFLVHVPLDPYSESDIGDILKGSALRLGWPMDADAAVELARHARRNPGCAQQLLVVAHNRALATGRSTVSLEVVAEVIERMRLYPKGLTETDVRALTILADRIPRGVGVAELCRALGVSQGQYTGMAEPFLALLGLVQTLSRRVITPAGLDYLAGLARPAVARPAVAA